MTEKTLNRLLKWESMPPEMKLSKLSLKGKKDSIEARRVLGKLNWILHPMIEKLPNML